MRLMSTFLAILASNIRSLQSTSAAEISNDILTPPPENPQQENPLLDEVGASDRGACVKDDASLKTNIEALSGGSEYRKLRPRPSETPNPSVPGPVSHDDSCKPLRKKGDGNAEIGQEKTKRSCANSSFSNYTQRNDTRLLAFADQGGLFPLPACHTDVFEGDGMKARGFSLIGYKRESWYPRVDVPKVKIKGGGQKTVTNNLVLKDIAVPLKLISGRVGR